MEKTANNFLAALKADLTYAALDSQNPSLNPGFFAGTVKNNLVDAQATASTTDAYGFTSISLTAVVAGTAGNSIATTATSTNVHFDHATLTNGALPPAATVAIDLTNLAYASENNITANDAIITTIAPPSAGQSAAALDYYALEMDYLYSQQTFIPDNQGGALAVTGATTVTYDLPFVMSTSEAYARVAKTAIGQGENVITQQFRLPQSYLTLEPSDVVTVTIAPFAYTVRINEATFNGDFSTSFSATNFASRNDVPIGNTDATGRLPQTIAGPSDGLPVVIDAPVRDRLFGTVPGVVDLSDAVRAYSTGFGLAAFASGKVVSGVATPAQLFTTSTDLRWGTIASLPAAVEPLYRTIEETITLSCKTIAPLTDLASASYYDFVAGKNCLAYGQPGNWEYIFFRDVVVVNANTVRLTGIIRGQRGTDAAVGGHVATDVAYLVASVATGFKAGALNTQSLVASEVGSVYRYTVNGLPSSRPAGAADVTIQGLGLFPFSPCRLKATLAAGNDLDLAWVRRDRLGGEFVTNAQVLSETSETYDLEIMSGPTVIRTVNGLTSPTYVYTSANQTTDGFAPPLASLKFRVYQNGELGRGFPRLESVNVS